jgi:hypothetical protein
LVVTFLQLAERCQIVLPDALHCLLNDGKTRYGTDTADWRKQWRSYMLAGTPAFSCVYDFEWLDPERAADTVEEWLNPTCQGGRKFLPFARSGAGDAYCLTPLANGDIGVALIWHDKACSSIGDASFEAFAYRILVESAWDCEHLLGDDFTIGEARESVIAGMLSVAAYLPDRLRIALLQLIEEASHSDAHQDQIITEQQAKAALTILPHMDRQMFPIVPRWECEKP